MMLEPGRKKINLERIEIAGVPQRRWNSSKKTQTN